MWESSLHPDQLEVDVKPVVKKVKAKKRQSEDEEESEEEYEEEGQEKKEDLIVADEQVCKLTFSCSTVNIRNLVRFSDT